MGHRDTLVTEASSFYEDEQTAFIIGERETVKTRVQRVMAASGCTVSAHLQKLATVALIAHSRRLTDFHHRGHAMLFVYAMEGRHGIRVHSGTLYVFPRGAVSLFSRLMSDLRRSKSFSMQSEGLFGLLLPSTVRTNDSTLEAVIKIFTHSDHAAQEVFLARLVDKCVLGMTPKSRVSTAHVRPECHVDVDVHNEGGIGDPLHEADGCGDDMSNARAPWTRHVADAVVRVSSASLSPVLSKRSTQMLVDWCETPCSCPRAW